MATSTMLPLPTTRRRSATKRSYHSTPMEDQHEQTELAECDEPRHMAGPAPGSVAGYLCNPAYVDADRRQGAHGAQPAGQPLVVGHPPCDRAGPDDLAHSLRRQHLRGEL